MMQPPQPVMQPTMMQGAVPAAPGGYGLQPGVFGPASALPVPPAPGSLQQQQQPQQHQPVGLQGKKPRRRVLTSLALQIFIYFGAWWDVFYYVLNILVFVYKGVRLPYPSRNFSMEFCFSWLWFIIEIPRLFLLSKGNKTERPAPMFFSFVVGAPILGMYIYFIAFQTYVLKIDQILNGIALGFMGIQLLLGLLATVRFIMANRFSQS